MRIELSLFAKQELERTVGRLGMKQIALASKVMEWFAGQDDVIQGMILGHFPGGIVADTARMYLEKLAAGNRS